jgi:hypothetical protein
MQNNWMQRAAKSDKISQSPSLGLPPLHASLDGCVTEMAHTKKKRSGGLKG